MTEKTADAPYVLRYVYAMLAVIVIAVTVVMGSLYLGEHDDAVTRDRVQSFHLESYLEAEQLLSEVSTLHTIVADTLQPDASRRDASTRISSVQIGHRGLLESMRSRLARLSALQDRYAAEITAASLQRLGERFARLDSTLQATPIARETIATIDGLDFTIWQFRRLHTVAADNELRALSERQRDRPRFLGVLIVCMIFVAMALWYLISSLNASLARQRESEAALAETQERLHNIQKLDALAQLVGGVAHDFNNLLTSVLGHTELLRESAKGNEAVQTGLNEIRTAGLRAAALTQQLLAFSRRQHADRRILDVNELLQEMEGLVKRTLGEGIKLTCVYTAEPYAVELDPGQFQQVMVNLISNARDATPVGGTLTISTENVSVSDGRNGVPDGEYLKLCITDSGTGMDEFTRQRLFEPFFTTKEKGRGTGLGLSTVHGIVTDSGGYIAVDSEKGRGTVFRIYLPRAEEQPAMLTQQADVARPQRGSETVLVVDDDTQILRFVESGLSSLGYRVLTASSGAAGLDICRTEPGEIHAIISDVVMSGTNGPKFMSAALRLHPGAMGIYISAYTEDIILWRPKEQNDIPLVTKPFEMEALAKVLRDKLDQFDDTGSSADNS